ncbi:MAG: hypothetical protein IM535_22015 [Pseudanabaena sp. M38BS1SP1A06MG]|nr:hypothetical protein [Pseudanabaena sp. M53BS1SP1A06MG]MCA6594698.1 hypothetical protein [Pseudanabaena sp. M38BS1SP1A06MG]
MSPSLLKKLVRYRTVITAIANAAITWVILIIAPLGLFAVITCTLGVFLGSLFIGNLSDKALLFLVRNSDQQNLETRQWATPEANQYIKEPERHNQNASNGDESLIQTQIKKLLK